MRPAVETLVASGQRRFLLPWAGAAVASLAVAGIGVVLAGDAAPSGAPLAPLAKAVTAGGFIWGAILLQLRRAVLGPAALAARIPAPDAEAVLRQMLAAYLVLWAATVVPAILGIAQLLSGGDLRIHLLLCAGGLWLLAYMLPTRAKLAAQAEAALTVWEKARGAAGA